MLEAKLVAGASELVELDGQLAIMLGTAGAMERTGWLVSLLSPPVQRTGASTRKARAFESVSSSSVDVLGILASS